MSSVHENLIAAKALFERDKGVRLNPLNAIRDSVSGEQHRTEAYMDLRRALPDGHRYVMQWLRDAKPTHADIVALFDRAIAATAPSGEIP